MMPNINPDAAAEASVLASGGYDACQNVVRDRSVAYLSFFIYLSKTWYLHQKVAYFLSIFC